nr:agmatine deiminase family protein [Luteimonas aquatica]
MPDEHARQARVFLAYGASRPIWKDWAGQVNATVALLARTIARYQPVTVLCRPGEAEDARRACGTVNIDYMALPLDDIWVRDYGGVFVVGGQGGTGLVDFNFNGWGRKQAFRRDAAVAAALSKACRVVPLQAGVTGEGGGIEVDGHGTAILTESCWVNENRNPGMRRERIEAELSRLLGLRKIIWLPGIRGRDITDAHVDFYARFVRPGVVVANLDNDPASYDYEVTRRHLDILKASTDAEGRKLQVHTLPPPADVRRNDYTDNPDFAAGYINYLPINGAVIAPQFGDAEADRYCNRLLRKLYPGRKVVQVDIDPIAAGGGGIHCVTKHMPAAARAA